ncbi:MAG: PfkB family carbohydrate kinase [Actinomycetota bacterium]|nr:PfkB family carbohydrate kinase [Actinomycetota bacterium]
MPRDRHNIVVFAPVLHLNVTLEEGPGPGAAEIHLHPGGQGFWIARMLRHLGERPLLCGPVGGETGMVLRSLLPAFGIDLSTVSTEAASPVYVYDRRSGDREVMGETAMPRLTRHEIDEVYGKILEQAMQRVACVIPGQTGDIFPSGFYRRLGADLAASETKVVGDLHASDLDALLEGGSIDILKVSDEELLRDGVIAGSGDPEVLRAISRFYHRGARAVVVSRGGQSALARFGDGLFEATPPSLLPADFRGAGDSMTAGFAAAIARGLGPEDTLRLGCAAGAANVTRHGLGSASVELIDALVERIGIRALTPVNS